MIASLILIFCGLGAGMLLALLAPEEMPRGLPYVRGLQYGLLILIALAIGKGVLFVPLVFFIAWKYFKPNLIEELTSYMIIAFGVAVLAQPYVTSLALLYGLPAGTWIWNTLSKKR